MRRKEGKSNVSTRGMIARGGPKCERMQRLGGDWRLEGEGKRQLRCFRPPFFVCSGRGETEDQDRKGGGGGVGGEGKRGIRLGKGRIGLIDVIGGSS